MPHAYVHMEVDCRRASSRLARGQREYQAREGICRSATSPFVIKATVEALRRYPTLNAPLDRQGPPGKRRINMGVAVAVDDGLLVPVIRDVDRLSIRGLNRAITEVADRARAGKLKLDDYGGGTFTIDNTGWFGSNLTMPIINVPGGRDPDHGGDHQAPGRRRDAGGRRHRDPPDDEHGPGHRPPRQRRRPGRRRFLATIRQWLESVERRHVDLVTESHDRCPTRR